MPNNTIVSFLAGWVIFQLLVIGFTGGIISNRLAMGKCELEKPEYHWTSPILGALIPLMFFAPEIDLDKYCAK